MISLGMILIAIGMLVVIGLFVAKPFVDTRARMRTVIDEITATDDPAPSQQRMALIKALRDLEFDYATDKVSEEDYQTLRAQILVDIASLDEAIASAQEVLNAQKPADLDALIEQAVRQRRGHTAEQCEHCGHSVRPQDRFCPMCGQPISRSTATCSKCGTDVSNTARFCPACGTPLAEAYEVMV